MRMDLPRSAPSPSLAPPRLMVLLTALVVAGCGGEGPPGDTSAERFACPSCNLVLISVDTLRADRVGSYGYPHPTTPYIDRWAENAIVFERAFATAPKTAESHMSVFTGLYPAVHQVFTVSKAARASPDQIHRLGDRIPTLPEFLKQSGYHTVGFHGGGNVAPKFGFDRGFDRYERADLDTAVGQRRISRFLDSMAARPGQRFFLFVHTYHVHAPYTPGGLPSRAADYGGRIEHDKKTLREMADRGRCGYLAECFWSLVDRDSDDDVQHLKTLYDAEIAEVDALIGALLAKLDGVPGETLVVLIGDHGEEFREHGGFEHSQLYNEILRVPLIIEHPRLPEGIRIQARVSLVDLLPTLLEMLGIEAEPFMQGSSLLPVLAGDAASREIYSSYPSFLLFSLIREDKKLILQGFPSRDMDSYRKLEIYDLPSDSGEEKNLSDTDSDLGEMFQQLVNQISENWTLRNQLQQDDPSVKESLPEETIRQLEALGYLE